MFGWEWRTGYMIRTFFSLEKKVLKIVHTSVRSFWMLCPPFPMTAPASFKY